MSDLEGRLSRIEAVASPVLEEHGLSLVDAEWRHEGRRWVLPQRRHSHDPRQFQSIRR